ncbi:unnamed protein product [Chrysodeixis includens]|uniref:Dynein intermediate chain 3, ciliary n=1 Tax=Chrysodeixis includens TaxID=689277 RepID=A0A9P0BUH5_CHRIL|nr:unnamed protein product [Chrysodeixis includens]
MIPRRAMGRQVMYCQQGPEMCDSLPTDMTLAKHYILRNPVHMGTQNTPHFSQHEINTIRADYSNTGCNHAEGGWPKDVHIHDPESTQRYRRKLEKEDGYIRCVTHLSPGLEHYVLQNNAIDMYQTYYTEMQPLPDIEHCDCRTVNVFRDVASKRGQPKRSVSSISWQPEGGHKFAVTYVNVDFNRDSLCSLNAYIWDVENATSPETTIVPPCPLLDLQYNPKDINILAGGLMNGQVGAWDKRSPRHPVTLCAPHVAHRDLVRNVLFINAKNGMEFFSAGTDGALKWWDLRHMGEPTEVLILDVIKSATDQQSMANANGVSVLEFEQTIPTRFMVGTENGLVITGNRKGKTPLEKLPSKYETHLGPVWALERNPGFLKNFLTVGDWTARIWSEECHESAIMWTAPKRDKVTDGIWSPTRTSLMMLTKWNGNLSVWDLLRRQHEPTIVMQVCEEPLVRVRAHEGGALLTCGSAYGNVYMLEMSRNLVETEKQDKTNLTAVLERESKRERILEARLREIRLKQRQAEEGSPDASLAHEDLAAGDRDLQEASTEYFAIIKKELTAF